MNADVVMERVEEASPRLIARIAGVSYLLTFLTGGVAQFAGGAFVLSGDAAATANNILSHRASFWLGFAAYLIVIACYITVTALFYQLFRPVNRSLSLAAALFSLVGCAIQASACLFYLAPLVVLESDHHSSVFNAEQLYALAYMLLELYGRYYSIGFVFFGFYCLLIGYLIFKSTFLPRILGVLMMFAGLGWLTFLLPPLANRLWPYVAVPGILGEASLMLWLVVRGVNVQRWKEQASAVGAR